ncbi:MAG TPA: hypothetical protein VNL74_00070 [Methylococcus sp.]|nr:hypothetical protein [Methylococcus sp.]
MKTSITIIATVLAALALGGCKSTREHLLDSEQSQLALRQIQTKAFDTTDKEKTLRSVIATLQDLQFVIDKADLAVGVVSGTKLSGYQLKMTVTVHPRGDRQMLVRANAQYNITPVTDPEPYQQFFAALQKSMFLTAHDVD